MIQTTFEGEEVFLLPYRASWGTTPTLSIALETEEQRREGGSEKRFVYDEAISTFKFQVILFGEEDADFRSSLTRIKDRRVLCPFWPAATLASDRGQRVGTDASGAFTADEAARLNTYPEWRTGIWFTFNPDLSAWAIHTAEEATTIVSGVDTIRVPLMLGYLLSDPEPVAASGTVSVCNVEFKESGASSYALRPNASDAVEGPELPSGFVPKVFNFVVDWSQEVKAAKATVHIEREQIGENRQPAQTFYPQEAARNLDLGFMTITAYEAARLATFFLSRNGTNKPFWIPGPMTQCALTGTIGGGDTVSVDRGASIGDNQYIALVRNDGAISIHHVELVHESSILLDVAPGISFTPKDSRVCAALLVRFKKSELQLQFDSDRVATARIQFIEVPTEYTDAPDDERQTYLYRFSRHYPGGTLTDAFTTFSSDVTLGGDVFLSRPIEHSEITFSMNPEENKTTIKSRRFTGNPLVLFAPLQLERPLFVEIISCEVDDLGNAVNPESMFYGRVRKPTWKGPIMSAEAQHLMQQLDRNVPKYWIQKTCNLGFCSPQCGKSEATVTFAATFVSQAGNVVTLSVAGGFSAGDFAMGKFYTGAGETFQERSIYSSTASGGGHITVTLGRPLTFVPSGQISIVKGCARTVAACKANGRYGADGFLGFPFVPNGNPSFEKIVSAQPQSKK